MPRHASSRTRSNHVIVSLFPFDHHHLSMPVETLVVVPWATLLEMVSGALGGDSRGHLTSVHITTPPTLDSLALDQIRRREELQEQPQDFTGTVRK
ncbi:hypothetical protein K435DRAFT_91140 [Dendrothele bispora CBS 962.96]|uniref:Uncharacterized protein n=1 Tax=Dendrothele bispora (strain CBS 962.96) TaxID=1314807 RepID=A0A4V4HB00_DENBC|nr:hypothetical protein K435DRAFT_91140 [Dendrothele bispora CBS 962.96]